MIFLVYKMTDPIKVFNNISDNVINFESKEEFMRYYSKNKETIDNMPTRGLNKKFLINGFKLGRIKKELTLFPIESALGKRLGSITNNESQNEIQNEDISMIELKLDNISERLKRIETQISILLKLCNQA